MARGMQQEIRSLEVGEPTPLVHPPPPDGNNAPYFAAESVSLTVDENTAAGTDIGSPVGATDDDSWRAPAFGNLRDQDALVYTIDSASAAVFDIERTSGQLRTKAPLDYESRDSYTVTVTVADPSLATATATVTITVIDVDEAPSLSGPRVVFHGSDDQDLHVTTFTAVDPEEEDITWSLEGDDRLRFSITDGRLSFLADPDFEAPTDNDLDNRYQVRVVASDSSTPPNRSERELVVAVTSTTPVSAPTPPTPGGPGGGGGGGGGDGPSPSTADYEWTVTHDIAALAQGQRLPHGPLVGRAPPSGSPTTARGPTTPSTPTTAATGARAADREFALRPDQPAPPRGFWGRRRHRLDCGTAAATGSSPTPWPAANAAWRRARSSSPTTTRTRAASGAAAASCGCWTAAPGSLFAYDLASGRLLARYALSAQERRPARPLVGRASPSGSRTTAPRSSSPTALPAPPRGSDPSRLPATPASLSPSSALRGRGVHAPLRRQQQQPARHLVGRRR